jgi:hypothetical protein
MNYYQSLDDQGKKEVKIAALVILIIIFVIYLLPSGFINKYKLSLSETNSDNNSNSDVKFDPYNSGLTAVVRSMGDTSGDRPAWQNIILNSDPLISATDTSVFSSDDTPADPQTANISDLVARDIYVADQAMISSSSTGDKAAIAAGLTSSVSNFVKAKVYTASDIKISTDNSITALKKYGEAVTLVTQKVDKIDQLKQYNALQNYTNTSDDKYLTDLTSDIETIKKTIEGLIAIPTPSKIAKNHIQLINMYSAKLVSFTNISLAKSDPIRGLIALGNAEKEMSDETKTLSEYITALEALGLEIGIITK